MKTYKTDKIRRKQLSKFSRLSGSLGIPVLFFMLTAVFIAFSGTAFSQGMLITTAPSTVTDHY
jgi:hypothetical protein